MQYATLEGDVRDGIAHVTLDRPDALNGLNLEMARELLDAALRCDEDPRSGRWCSRARGVRSASAAT